MTLLREVRVPDRERRNRPPGVRRRIAGVIVSIAALAVSVTAIGPVVLVSVDAIPAHLAGRFREDRGFSQAAAGHFLIFDRRAHTVFGIDEAMSAVYTIVEIGAEPGRIVGPTAFGVGPDGSFVVADAPQGMERVQVFSPAGQLQRQFRLPGEAQTRLTIDGFAVGGVAGLHYTGHSLLMSRPEWGALITEYSLAGEPLRTFGELRPTGHETDPEVHRALNTGLVLGAPDGGFFFVFQTGRPAIRRYDSQGRLLFERQVEGRELDPLLATLPDRWPRGAGEQPMIAPTVRAGAVDPQGQLWISLRVPFTYVFDRDGDKTRVVQLRAAGVVSPNSLTFGENGRLLVTPGLAIFDPAIVSTLPADTLAIEPVTMQPQPPIRR